MGFIDWLIRKDVTRGWVEFRNQGIIVDLDRASLAGVCEDQPIELLSTLGSAENREMAQEGNLVYYSKGLWICEDEGLLSSFEVYFASDEFAPFVGTIRWYGQSIRLNPETTPKDVKVLLGDPDEEADDDRQLELVYAPSDNVCFSVMFNSEGYLESIEFV